MLKELFEAIYNRADANAKLAAAATDPKFFPFDPYKETAYKKGDELVFTQARPPLRRHTVSSLEDLVQFAFDHMVGGKRGVCWYSLAGISFFLCDELRDHIVNLPLVYHPQFDFLQDQNSGDGSISQRDLYRELRTTFKRSVDQRTVEAIKNLKFEALTAGTSDLQRGKSSMGQQVIKELKGVMELPEDVTFTKVAVWAGHVEYVDKCDCYLDPDEQNKTLTLKPIPGEIARITANAEKELGARLALSFGQSDIPSSSCMEADPKPKILLYCGKP